MLDAGALALVLHTGTWLLRPRHDPTNATDSQLLEDALPDVELAFHDDAAHAVARVAKGEAAAAVLLRPPTLAQVAVAAHAGRLLPEKTTSFHPKPATGLVFRTLTAGDEVTIRP